MNMKEVLLRTGSRVQDEKEGWLIVVPDTDEYGKGMIDGPFVSEQAAVEGCKTFGVTVAVIVTAKLAEMFGCD